MNTVVLVIGLHISHIGYIQTNLIVLVYMLSCIEKYIGQLFTLHTFHRKT